MNIKPEVLKIRKGLFFPEDFSKLPEGTFIYISKGILINIEEGKETEETKTEEETETKQKVKHKHKHKKRKYTKREGKKYGRPSSESEISFDKEGFKEDDKEVEEETEEETETEEAPVIEFPRKKVQYSSLQK